jgi:hypothetical protein
MENEVSSQPTTVAIYSRLHMAAVGPTASNVFQPRVGFVEADQTVGKNQRRTHFATSPPASQYLGASSFFALAEEARRASLSLRLAAFHPAAQEIARARRRRSFLGIARRFPSSRRSTAHRTPRTAQRKRRLERPWDHAAAANPSCRPERESIVMGS